MKRAAIGLIALFTGCDSDVTQLPPPPPLVLNSFASYGHPVWTPDGNHLLFNYRPIAEIAEIPPGSGRYYYIAAESLGGVYTLDLQTSVQRRLLPRQLGGLEAAHRGDFLYYEDQGQIWRISMEYDSLDASSPLQITYSPDGAFGPSLSSLDTRLLYYVGAGGPRPGVYITGAAGGPTRPIGQVDWLEPDWLPSDSAFVFTWRGTTLVGVGIVDTFGVNAAMLQQDGHSARPSPDGLRIAYVSRTGSSVGRGALWVMDRDGSNPRQLTSESVLSAFNWSPDGTEIAYTRFVDNDTSYANGTLWIIDPATLAKRQVTTNPRP